MLVPNPAQRVRPGSQIFWAQSGGSQSYTLDYLGGLEKIPRPALSTLGNLQRSQRYLWIT